MNKLIQERDNIESNITQSQREIDELYKYISDQSDILIKLNKQIYKNCNHKWDKGTYQKYGKPEYKCIICNLITTKPNL